MDEHLWIVETLAPSLLCLRPSPCSILPPALTSAPMSHAVARLVFAVTAAFFAAFFLWPVLQILKGGFIDADGHLTFAYLTALLGDPTYLAGLRNSFLLACASTLLALLL